MPTRAPVFQLNDLRKTRAAKTVNRKRGDILALWRHAKRRSLLSPPEAIEVVHFPEPKRRPDAYRLDELARRLEACEQFRPKRNRWKRYRIYNRMPPVIRPFLFFLYRYFFRLGFLDGIEGFAFHFLHGLWYPMLIDLKYIERKRAAEHDAKP